MDTSTLEAQFRAALAVFWGQGSVERLFEFLDDRGAFVDEDTPFVLGKADFRDHVDFHLKGNWQSLEWVPRELRSRVTGTTGIVTCYFTLRGKPRGAGFRLRHGVCSALCFWDGHRWHAATLHLDPILGHVLGASPA